MNRPQASLSTLLVSTAMLCAAPAWSQETDMIKLQQQMATRAAATQMTTGLTGSINDSNKAVSKNVGGSSANKDTAKAAAGGGGAAHQTGLAPGGASASARALNPQPLPPARALPESRKPAGQALSALNPQPLPPVERGRRGSGALPNGIIIVGGKDGVAR